MVFLCAMQNKQTNQNNNDNKKNNNKKLLSRSKRGNISFKISRGLKII